MGALEIIPNFQCLNLSKNQVGRRGCNAIARLVEYRRNFVELDLSSYNKIDSAGATLLAHALKNRPPEFIRGKSININLSTLLIEDAGACAFVGALELHRPLLEDGEVKTKIKVNLSYNKISAELKEDFEEW